MSAAGTIGLFQNNILISGMCIIFGKLVDILVLSANILDLPQDALNTISFVVLAFYVFPFLYLVATLLNHLIIANNESGGVR